jgi:GT2 family glycosyltransferase
MRLGGFHERFVTHFEDMDFALRAKQDEIPPYVVVDPNLSALHKVSPSAENPAAH